HVQLHPVGPVGARSGEGLDGVLGGERARPPMSDDEWPTRGPPPPHPDEGTTVHNPDAHPLDGTKRVPPERRRINIIIMRRAFTPAPLPACLSACAPGPPPAPAGPSRQLQSEAAHTSRIVYEDDFQEARLLFQALPEGVPERVALREKLLHY